MDSSIKPPLQQLKTLQDELDEWHDRTVLQQYMPDLIARPGFLAEEPGMSCALLLEMARDQHRDHALINEILDKAEKLAREWVELKPPTASEAETTTDQ